jgi:hypothetical protein
MQRYSSNCIFGNCSVNISSGTPTVLTKSLLRFPHSFQVTSDTLSRIGHDSFLRHYFKLIVTLSLNHSALCSLRNTTHNNWSAMLRSWRTAQHVITRTQLNRFPRSLGVQERLLFLTRYVWLSKLEHSFSCRSICYDREWKTPARGATVMCLKGGLCWDKRESINFCG